MDPISVLSIIEASLLVIKPILKFCSACKNAYQDLPSIIDLIELECNTWKALIARLEGRLKTDSPSGPPLNLVPFSVLGKVCDHLSRLHAFIRSQALQDETSKRAHILKTVKWLAKEKKVHDLLNELAPIKVNFSLALDLDSSFELHGLKTQIQQIEKTISDKSQQMRVLNLLKLRESTPPDTHCQKQDLRVSETCDWIFQSTLWAGWLRGGSSDCCRFLFIYGMPGSGKTILASALIDELYKAHGKRTLAQKQEHKNGFSYYYCSHEHNVDEKRPFLRWIVYDLCRQLQDYVPVSLAEATDVDEISDDTLLASFLSISKQFEERVYIVVDAVDESRSPRDEFLKILTTIGVSEDYKHVSFIAIGRPEMDINRAFGASEDKHHLSVKRKPAVERSSPQKVKEQKKSHQDSVHTDTQNAASSARMRQEDILPGTSTLEQQSCQSETEAGNMDVEEYMPQQLPTFNASTRNKCTTLGMDNVYVRQAIEIYVHSMLKEIGFFKLYGEHKPFALEIQEKLAAKARGMFRLVSCQIELLRNSLYDPNSIRRAINNMPDTIFAMYGGITRKWVPGGVAPNHVARNALALICSPTSEIPCAEVLVEAARMDVSTNTSLIRFSLKNLRELLGCLIKVTTLKRKPDSVFSRNEEGVTFRQVLPAHYTVTEFVYDKSTAQDPLLNYFSQTPLSNLILELQIAWMGLTHFGQNRPANNARIPTRFEEYSLVVTDKSLRLHRKTITEETSICELVFFCLKYGSPHSSYMLRPRKAFPTWFMVAAPGIYERDGIPVHENTTILVSLMILDWPEMAKRFLSTFALKDRVVMWKDMFTFEFRHQRDVAKNSRLVFRPQTTILKACVALRRTNFLQALVDCGADFLGEPDIIYYALERHWGNDVAAFDDTTTTDVLLKILLDAGADPCPKGYLFTLLQFIVSKLEEPWVHTVVHRLQYRNGNINMVGTPDSKHPYVEDDDDYDDHDWFEMHPLEICRTTVPDWASGPGHEDEVEQSRTQIELLLRQFGAFETDGKQPRGLRGAAGIVVNISDDEDDALA